MRILKLNNIVVDLDDKTSIGIDFQAYDVKEPGKRFINVSNQFTIPKTITNLNAIGFTGEVQNVANTIYEIGLVDYYVDNEAFIHGAKFRVDSISDRIYLFVFDRKDIWDQLKAVDWYSFYVDFYHWLVQKKNLPDYLTTAYNGTWADFVSTYVNSTEGLHLSYFFSNLRQPIKLATGEYNPEVGYNMLLNYYYNTSPDYFNGQSNHWCVFVKTIFEYIEDKYSVDFLTEGGKVPGNIWDDQIANKLYIPMAYFNITATGDYSDCSVGFYVNASPNYIPYQNLRDKDGKTLYDFVNAFFQHLNIIKDEKEIDGKEVIALRRFDQIESDSDIVNWSGKITGQPYFKPYTENLKQNNYIKFKSRSKELSDLVNSKNIISSNKSLDMSGDMLQIDSYIPGLDSFLIDWEAQTFETVLNLSDQEAFKTFVFMIDGDLTDWHVNVTYIIPVSDGVVMNYPIYVHKAQLYSLDSEYTLLGAALDKPKYYEADAWLKPSDIKDLEFFKMYFFKELNGSFFLNKISGYNPEKSLNPVKLELLRISDKTPALTAYIDYWSDSNGEAFTDGENDNFF